MSCLKGGSMWLTVRTVTALFMFCIMCEYLNWWQWDCWVLPLWHLWFYMMPLLGVIYPRHDVYKFIGYWVLLRERDRCHYRSSPQSVLGLSDQPVVFVGLLSRVRCLWVYRVGLWCLWGYWVRSFACGSVESACSVWSLIKQACGLCGLFEVLSNPAVFVGLF